MKRTRTLGTIVVLALMLVLVAGLSVQLPQGAAHAQDPDREPAPQGVAAPQAPLGTSFTYQGKLTDGGSPADGEYDLRFDLYDAAAAGTLLGTVTVPDHQVTAGLFTVHLDFGDVFTGTARFLEIAVRPGASAGAFTTLTPRQELTPAPYALALPGLWTMQNTTSPNLIGGYEGNWVTGGVVGATIGGGGFSGSPNRVTANYGTVAGGKNNAIESSESAIGGGSDNGIGSYSIRSTIGGGWYNGIGSNSKYGTIGGGWGNVIADNSTEATIGGGRGNDIMGSSGAATIGGGYVNLISGTSGYATISGGHDNNIGAGSNSTTIGGGEGNDIGDDSTYATIGGGYGNPIGDDSDYSTIGGGYNNNIGFDSDHCTTGGGFNNDIGDHCDYSFIGGGSGNTATSSYATVPGGRDNEANGNFAFAAGRQAIANHDGAFVWADSTDADFASEWDNQFRVRATGGVRLDINNNQWFDFRYKIVGTLPPVPKVLDTSTGAYLSGGGAWTDSSDRNAKENYSPVDNQDLLSRLAELPVSTWNYKAEDPSVRHMGPTAQDFYGAFGLGADNTHVAALDTSGVALAAIQGLYAQNQELAAENATLQSQVDSLQQQNAGFEARLAALESGRVARSPASGLPTWLLLGGLVLVGGVVLRLSLRDSVRAHRHKRSPGERNGEQQLGAEGNSTGPRAIGRSRIALLEMVCVSWERLLGRRGGGGAG